MKKGKLPSWSGPVVGAVIGGVYFGMEAAARGPQFDVAPFVIGGAIIGCVAGCLVWIIDLPTRTSAGGGTTTETEPPASGTRNFLGRLFTLLSLLVCWAPWIGFVLALVAVLLNRRARGWPRVVSWISFGMNLVVTGLYTSVLILGWLAGDA